jgi:Fe-S-cluster containining protein
MILIGDILISDDLIEEQFLCNLSACKGACCWEGDWGAPLEREELYTLENIYEAVRPFLSDEDIATIEAKGLFTYFEDPKMYGTSLQPDGACVFMVRDDLGVAKCGIEQAYLAGQTDFRKPISCHLYPVRVSKNEENGFEALNYDRWDICSAACELGKEKKLPVFQFVREALIRRYGAEFFEELEAAAQYCK